MWSRKEAHLSLNGSPVNFPRKCQWCGDRMFSSICTWINSWVNNRHAEDLRRNCAHYEVIVIILERSLKQKQSAFWWLILRKIIVIAVHWNPNVGCNGSLSPKKDICLYRIPLTTEMTTRHMASGRTKKGRMDITLHKIIYIYGFSVLKIIPPLQKWSNGICTKAIHELINVTVWRTREKSPFCHHIYLHLLRRDTLLHKIYYELHFLTVRSDIYIHVVLAIVPKKDLLVQPVAYCLCTCTKFNRNPKFGG